MIAVLTQIGVLLLKLSAFRLFYHNLMFKNIMIRSYYLRQEKMTFEVRLIKGDRRETALERIVRITVKYLQAGGRGVNLKFLEIRAHF